jgi:hypothetical protein
MEKRMDIWRKPAYQEYVQSELTDEIVREAEATLGVKLPAEYIALLKIQNGGYIRYTLPDDLAVNADHHLISGIGSNFPSLVQGADWGYDDDICAWLEGLIPFDGDGHWHLCFDYRRNKSEPEITFIEIDDLIDQLDAASVPDPENDGFSKVIARNFAEYLALLVPDNP